MCLLSAKVSTEEPAMPSRKITKTTIDGAKSGERDYFIWDSDLSGFGLKVSKGGRKSYVCQALSH
jgi:hypothetical protein